MFLMSLNHISLMDKLFFFLYPFALHTFQSNPRMSVKLYDIQYSKTKALKVIHTNKNSIRYIKNKHKSLSGGWGRWYPLIFLFLNP